MRILVVGAGATGGYFGAKLAAAGRDVTFLVRKRRAAQIEDRGLRITGQGDDHVLTPNLVTADQFTGPYDLVLLSVKATALLPAVEDLAPAVGPTTTIVPFLNGMAHMDVLNDRFGADRVLGCVVMVATTVTDDGDIVRLAPMQSITVGEQDGGSSQRLSAVADVLGGAGFDFAVIDDVLSAMWSKWVFITTVGAVTCLMRGTVGDVVAVPGGGDLGPALADEGAAVAAAAGFPVPAEKLAATKATVTAAGAPTTSSLYRDLVSGQPTEGEHLFGDLIARARALSVPTPLLDLATMHLRVHEHVISH
ncbi:MAG TPA: ketopantoate reductase family protein [Pseudonocardiaceae bacterium]|nr:ketopantoate reductase family protein [Pseudonocardiaceae bacterium]